MNQLFLGHGCFTKVRMRASCRTKNTRATTVRDSLSALVLATLHCSTSCRTIGHRVQLGPPQCIGCEGNVPFSSHARGCPGSCCTERAGPSLLQCPTDLHRSPIMAYSMRMKLCSSTKGQRLSVRARVCCRDDCTRLRGEAHCLCLQHSTTVQRAGSIRLVGFVHVLVDALGCWLRACRSARR